jgi:peptidylprolyl isomerase
MSWLKNLLLGSVGTKSSGGASGPTKVADGDYETTSSGLMIHDLQTGGGASPQKGQKVTVHYTGWLTNGKSFDSSKKRNKPFTFEIGKRKVIRGWDEGVLTMKVGGHRQLKVPAALGYGAVGSPPAIPKNATLIFEVELLEIG